MQPKIVKKDTLYITGLTGEGTKTGEVWNTLDSAYNKNAFEKADESAYEIRFWGSRKTGKEPESTKNVHVGFLAQNAVPDGYTTVALPAVEYAVFDVYVAKGYDSGNAQMEKWLDDNKFVFGLREFDGFEYVIECYNEKFKDGDKPDSIVEIWLPIFRFCQCCYMPMINPEDFGTEADGNPSVDYCCHCYQKGAFTSENTLEEAIEENIQFWREEGDKGDDEARARIREVFPKLKRWMK